MRQEILRGVERRRRWTDEQKLAILSEVGEGGWSVAAVARRHYINRHQIYRKQPVRAAFLGTARAVS